MTPGALRRLAGLLFALALPAAAQTAPDTRIRAYAEPAGGAWVAQQLRVFVEVSTDTQFLGPPDFPGLQIDGAIVLEPEVFGVNFTRTRGSRTYVGQRRSYLVFPQRSGPLRIPPITVGMVVAEGGTGRRELQMSTLPLTLDVTMPPGAESLAQFVSVPRLTVSEVYAPSPRSLRVGDAFRRTITIGGDDTLALVLPTVTFEAPAGVAVYKDSPRLRETADRGRYTGTRVESVTYVLEREGDFTLPPIEIKWWNTATRSMQTETLPGIRLAVAPASGPVGMRLTVQESAPTVSAVMRLGRLVLDWLVAHAEIICILAGLSYLGWLAWRRFAPQLRAGLAARRERRLDSEPYRFRRFELACRDGDARRVSGAFWRWVESLRGEANPERAFSAIWGELAADRYRGARGAGAIDTARLLRSARSWRAAHQRRQRRRRERAARALNPVVGSTGRD